MDDSPLTATIRDSVTSQVNDCLWLDDLKSKYSEIGQGGEGAVAGARCVVCSLPVGSCKHNTKWLDKMAPWNKNLLGDESVDDGLSDLMDVLGAGSVIAPTAYAPEFNFNNIRWCRHVPRVADVIGADKVQVSFPGCRGFHTAVAVGDVVVVFGGLQYRETMIPQPFSSSIRPGDVHCLSDVYLYHIVKASWHRVRCDVQPEPRYGHVCAALDEDTMVLFGGRSQTGKLLSDTWFFSVSASRWTALEQEELSPPPAARVFSAMCSLNDSSVLLFGGTDGAQNYGDVWIFRAAEWRWERGVTAGLPPQPRYGHAIATASTSPDGDVDFGGDVSVATMRAGRSNDALEVVVMGGCTVNPVSEISAASEGPLGTSIESQAQAKQLAYLNKALQDAYAAEGNSAVLSGQVISGSIELGSMSSCRDGVDSTTDIKSVYQEAARAAARISALEKETRALENQLTQSWYESQAMHDYNKRTARHPMKALDTFILSIGDMVWMQQKKKSITGAKPPARMLFTAATMGSRFVIVKGGVLPTALGYRPVDKEYTRLHVFDTQKLCWTNCTTVASKESMNEPLHMANMEIARAKQRVDIEHRRGMMLGAPGGLTAELLEARRMAEVSEWRKDMLLAELDSMIAPPPPRWGDTGVPIGSRILVYGGWTDRRAAMEEDTLVLDAEDDLERARRLEDEFQARIETERLENEARGRGNDLQSAFELRMILAAEREREENERRIMGVCDILSRLPELTRPPPIRFVKSNEHTIWVEWDPTTKDAYGKPVQDVEYLLIMSGGYVPLGVNDRVEVKPSKEFMKKYRQRATAEAELKKLAKKKTGMAALDAAIRESERYERGRRKKAADPEVEDIPFFRGEIVHSRPEGTFDVRYDDGSLESRVKRERIALEYDHPDPSVLSGKAAERLRETLRKKDELKMKEMTRTVAPILSVREEHASTSPSSPKIVTFGEFDVTGDFSRCGTLSPPTKESSRRGSYLDDVFDILPMPTLSDRQVQSRNSDTATSPIPPAPDSPRNDLVELDDVGGVKNFNRTITQDIPSSYKVVYRGTDLQHICEGIVPLEVVNNEPDFVVSVNIALMTIGTDYPDDALSQMSEPVVCSTRRTRIWDTLEDPYGLTTQVSGLDSEDDISTSTIGRGSTVTGSMSINIPPPGSPGKSTGHSTNVSPEKKAPVVLMSKKKKDIVTAVLNGNQTIEMERKKAAILSAGVFDHFV